MALPTDSTHLSHLEIDDLIEVFGGEVDSQFAKRSIMRDVFNIRKLTGTSTATVRRIARGTIQKVTPGVRPDASPVAFGKTSVTVDTVILERANVFLLDDIQSDIATRQELALNQGKELARYFDQTFLIVGTKATKMAAPTDVDSIKGGYNKELAVDEETDADVVADEIMNLLVAMEDDEQDTDDLIVFVRPSTFQTLLKNDKLVSRDFSEGNGDFAKRKLFYIGDARIVKTPYLPKTAGTHLLSNTANGNAYDVTAEDTDIIALIMDPMALLAAENIPLTTNIYWDDKELQYFIDSYLAFGVSVRRPDMTAGLFKFRA